MLPIDGRRRIGSRVDLFQRHCAITSWNRSLSISSIPHAASYPQRPARSQTSWWKEFQTDPALAEGGNVSTELTLPYMPPAFRIRCLHRNDNVGYRRSAEARIRGLLLPVLPHSGLPSAEHKADKPHSGKPADGGCYVPPEGSRLSLALRLA